MSLPQTQYGISGPLAEQGRDAGLNNKEVQYYEETRGLTMQQ